MIVREPTIKNKVSAWLHIIAREMNVDLDKLPKDYFPKITMSCIALFENILGYHKLPTPDSKEYQELKDKIFKVLTSIDSDYIKANSYFKVADKVLALLEGRNEN